jgi:5-hydroxyisourate hydrolase-like protein (transthyretin family)
MGKMIIHSYLTDGFYGWAEIFIKSFVYFHGTTHKIVLTTRDLTDEQIHNLQMLYQNLIVKNKSLDLKNIAERARLTIKEIKKLKRHIENSAVNRKTFIWKQAISVEDRYRNSILEAMDEGINGEYLIHFDIDMYFRSELSQLFEIVTNNDISIKFRLGSKINRKVMGGLIGFRICDKTKEFMNRWKYYIDELPLYKKPLGYGQTSFYLAYCDLQEKIKWGHIPSKFISPRFLETDVIWSGNTKKGKEYNLKLCYKDFSEMRNKNETK